MFTRNQTKVVNVGKVKIGGNNPIVVQSMTNSLTKDVKKTVRQIKLLEKYGCQLIRVAVLDTEDALSIKEIKKMIKIPLVADIHFDYKLALLAIENGADKIRINPGNIGSIDKIEKVVLACKAKNIPIRIGINSGSLEKDIQDMYGTSPRAMIESANRHIKLLEDLHFSDIILSLKSSDPKICLDAYKLASETFIYPLHIGVTEAGTLIPAITKSSIVLNELLKLNIGNTIRVSISDSPLVEVKAAKLLLKENNLITMPTLISCPTCGRTQIDLIKYTRVIEDYLYTIKKDIKVAIMGCVVNGPGEARDADIGVAGGKNCAVLFNKGKIIKTIPEKDIISELKKEINKL